MTKEEILLKVMSMLKNNQVEFLMELSEIKNNSLYQAIVDVLEYYSPFIQKLFCDWRRYHRMHPRPNRLPIPYTTDSWEVFFKDISKKNEQQKNIKHAILKK